MTPRRGEIFRVGRFLWTLTLAASLVVTFFAAVFVTLEQWPGLIKAVFYVEVVLVAVLLALFIVNAWRDSR